MQFVFEDYVLDLDRRELSQGVEAHCNRAAGSRSTGRKISPRSRTACEELDCRNDNRRFGRGISAGTREPAACLLPRTAARFGNRLRLYLNPWPSGPDARHAAHPPRRAQGLSSGLLRQATSSCAEDQARRGAGTAIPSHGSLRDRSRAISLDRVAVTLRPLTRLPH